MPSPCAALLLSQISSLTSVSSTTSFQNCARAAVSVYSPAPGALLHTLESVTHESSKARQTEGLP